VLVVLASTLFVATHLDPRRPRPAGWRAPWDTLTLEPESVWAPDVARRTLVQALFFEATPALTECTEEYFRGVEAVTVQLELLFEAVPEGVRLTYVVPEVRGDLPAGLMPCVERALEKGKALPLKGAKAGDRWRLGLAFVINPVSELAPAPWWQRFVPDSWRSGGGSIIHVG
jgi:hypothetical protein